MLKLYIKTFSFIKKLKKNNKMVSLSLTRLEELFSELLKEADNCFDELGSSFPKVDKYESYGVFEDNRNKTKHISFLTQATKQGMFITGRFDKLLKNCLQAFMAYLELAYPANFHCQLFGNYDVKKLKYCYKQIKEADPRPTETSPGFSFLQATYRDYLNDELRNASIDREYWTYVSPDADLSLYYDRELNDLDSDRPFLHRNKLSDLFLLHSQHVLDPDYHDTFEYVKEPRFRFYDGFIMEGKTEMMIRDLKNVFPYGELCSELDWLWRLENVRGKSMLEEPENNFLLFFSFILKGYLKLRAMINNNHVFFDRSILGHYAFCRLAGGSKELALSYARLFFLIFGNDSAKINILIRKNPVWPIERKVGREFEYGFYKSEEQLKKTYEEYMKFFHEALFEIYNINENLIN